MRYIKAYIIASILGIISEFLVTRGQHHCIQNLTMKCIRNGIFLNLYGWSAVIITMLLDFFRNKSIVLLIGMSIILINCLECIGGQLSSYMHNGKQTWKYDSTMIPTCNGYISIISSAYFTILLGIFILLIYPKLG